MKIKKEASMIVKRRRKKIEQGQEPDGIKRVNIGVKIRLDLWGDLRGLAIKQGRNSGELLDAAIEDYLLKIKEIKDNE